MVISFLLKLFFLIFPFGQIPKVSLFLPEIRVSMIDLIVILIVLVGEHRHIFISEGNFIEKKFHSLKLAKEIVIFLFAIILSFLVNFWFHSQEQVFVALSYLIRLLFYWALYFVVAREIKEKRLATKMVFDGLIFAGTLSAVFGLLQYFLYPDLANLYYLDWDPHYHRVFGTFLDPGFLAVILGLTLIILTIRILSAKDSRLFNVILWLIVFVSFLLTYARSAYVGFILAMLSLALIKKKIKAIFLILLVFSFLLLLLPRPAGEGVKLERTASTIARVDDWRDTTEIIKGNWLFGVGFNFLRYTKKGLGRLGEDWQFSHSGAGTDSSLLFIWATVGVLGLASFMAIFLSSLKKSFSKRNSPESLTVFLSLILLLTTSFFLNTLFYPFLVAWTAILLATCDFKANK